jgi:hypothetical protein
MRFFFALMLAYSPFCVVGFFIILLSPTGVIRSYRLFFLFFSLLINDLYLLMSCCNSWMIWRNSLISCFCCWIIRISGVISYAFIYSLLVP